MFNLKIAFRYAFSKIRRQRLTSVIICLGIAAGIFAMFVIMSIMNGLQSKQIDTLRAVESFDIMIKNTKLSASDIKNLENNISVFEFAETPVLINNLSTSESTSARIRAVDPSYFEHERVRDNFTYNAVPREGISLSYTLGNILRYSGNNSFEITFLRPGKTATIVPYTQNIEVNAFYTSSLAEYNSATVLCSLDTYKAILGNKNTGYGIFCSTNVDKLTEKIKEIDPNAEVQTWKEYNNAVYGALVLEKTIMYIFLSFVFLIICVNLKNSTRRLINSHKLEGAMLRALGYNRQSVRSIFIFQGLIVCVIGEVAGALLGLLALNNMDSILSLIGRISGSSLLIASMINPILSSTEIIVILLAVLLLGLIYTYAGCRKIFKSEIMEVIYDVSD